MKNKDLIVCGGILIAAIAFFGGVLYGANAIQRSAIKAGVAHYTVNPTNGITQFEFKKQ